jgi:hypothetical protein
MTTTRGRWKPDPSLVLAARAGAVKGAGLEACDRAWAVALLMEGEGLTGAEAAETLRCSLRLVRLIRAEPLYPLAAHAASLTRQLADTESAASNQIRDMQRDHTRLSTEIVRLTSQKERLITSLDSKSRELAYWKGRCA